LTREGIPCFRCGICCQRYQPYLDLEEVKLISSKLGITPEEFLEQYADARWPSSRSFLIRHNEQGCIFLTTGREKYEKLCLIHSFKPACCSAWQAGLQKPECRDGLRLIWSLDLDEFGCISGDEKKIEEFLNFLKLR